MIADTNMHEETGMATVAATAAESRPVDHSKPDGAALRQAYERDGHLFPIDIMCESRAAALRARLEQVEQTYGAPGRLPRPLGNFLRVNAHVVMSLAAEIARHPRILDAVEAVLGPDLLCWSCEFFIKEPRTDKIVSWHQDLTYWGMGATQHEVTAWLALSPVTVESGCMRFVSGSHENPIMPHHDTFAAENLLSRGQEIAVEVNEADAVNVELRPGQLSLHHGLMFHASGPNRSGDRRIACAIRYITPDVRQEVGERDYAMLVRGADHKRNFINIAGADADFTSGALALYDRILVDQSAALAQGATGKVSLYS